MRAKYLYRVIATVDGFPLTRHFQSKPAALHFVEVMSNTYEDVDGYRKPRASSITFQRSAPIEWPGDADDVSPS